MQSRPAAQTNERIALAILARAPRRREKKKPVELRGEKGCFVYGYEETARPASRVSSSAMRMLKEEGRVHESSEEKGKRRGRERERRLARDCGRHGDASRLGGLGATTKEISPRLLSRKGWTDWLASQPCKWKKLAMTAITRRP